VYEIDRGNLSISGIKPAKYTIWIELAVTASGVTVDPLSGLIGRSVFGTVHPTQ